MFGSGRLVVVVVCSDACSAPPASLRAAFFVDGARPTCKTSDPSLAGVSACVAFARFASVASASPPPFCGSCFSASACPSFRPLGAPTGRPFSNPPESPPRPPLAARGLQRTASGPPSARVLSPELLFVVATFDSHLCACPSTASCRSLRSGRPLFTATRWFALVLEHVVLDDVG